MVKLGTFCEDCCFYDKQIENCKHGLIEVFKNRGAEIIWEDSYPKIDRVCQYKRQEDWQSDKTDEEKIQLCKKEIYITGTIILLADDKETLLKSILQLNQFEHIDEFKIIVIYKGIMYKDVLNVCGNNLKSEYRCLKTINNDIEFQIYKALKFAKNGYLFILEAGKSLDESLIDKVNNFVNRKMFRLLHIQGTDGLHQSVSMIHLYKWLKGDLGTNFGNKLKSISQQENSDHQVSNWKEVNEQYSS
jgi:hypothetical protein